MMEPSYTLEQLLDSLFPAGHQVERMGHLVAGTAQTSHGPVALLGTTDAAAINHAIALDLAHLVLSLIEEAPQRPLVFLVDTQGQALSRHEELLCLNGSFAHLARCVDLARRLGHVSLSLITGQAVSGGFLSYGLMADRVFAVQNAQVRVMDLRAMSRVTKLPLERLQALASESPIFAPGAENFLRMGAIDAIWNEVDVTIFEAALLELMQTKPIHDGRSELGRQRGGRLLSADVIECVRAA